MGESEQNEKEEKFFISFISEDMSKIRGAYFAPAFRLNVRLTVTNSLSLNNKAKVKVPPGISAMYAIGLAFRTDQPGISRSVILSTHYKGRGAQARSSLYYCQDQSQRKPGPKPPEISVPSPLIYIMQAAPERPTGLSWS